MLLRAARIVFLALCIALFVYGLVREIHLVYGLSGDKSSKVSGPGFTEAASYDGVMLQGSRLYDVYSITGVTASADENGLIKTNTASPGASKPKDCKT